jgi:hypothetical protein
MGPERHVRHALALGAVEVGADDHARAGLGQLADGGHQALDARHVGDAAVLHRQVQVGAQEHALAGDGGDEVVEGAEGRHGGS